MIKLTLEEIVVCCLMHGVVSRICTQYCVPNFGSLDNLKTLCRILASYVPDHLLIGVLRANLVVRMPERHRTATRWSTRRCAVFFTTR